MIAVNRNENLTPLTVKGFLSVSGASRTLSTNYRSMGTIKRRNFPPSPKSAR